MPIGIGNQFMLSIKEAERDDQGQHRTIGDELIEIGEFREMLLVEEVGLNLPYVQFQFNLKDEEKFTKMTKAGFIFELGLGRSSIEYKGYFRVHSDMTNGPMSGTDTEVAFQLWAYLDHPDYIATQRFANYRSTSEPMTSSEVWKEVCERNFLEADTEDSDDAMMWVQGNQTDRAFLKIITDHAYFKDNDVALSGIRRDGKAIFKPLSSLKGANKFQVKNSGGQGASSLALNRQHGFQSQLSGAVRVTPTYSMETGEHATFSSEATPQILDKGQDDAIIRHGKRGMVGDNVHKYYAVAEATNLQFKSSLSATEATVDFQDYKDIYILQYADMDWGNTGSMIGKSMMVQGDWICTKVQLQVSNNVFKQYVSMARETLLD